ncbi:hypothetical protein [Bradyrhizobium sp. SZCCHNR1015]|uniref:hypothetical protein n=1 Tax=Bradyrhizobium sp. SZCCHNR1015 TaxID=3057338 RepID=UPI002915E465|nr:hypothetical protein [Bradyrhizobium sp. SZCCHNR1015]
MVKSNEPAFSDQGRELIIPLEPALLGEFILGLLGQRRSIDQQFRDRIFLIDIKWLLNLDDIVEQRISSQNAGSLVSFSAKIYYDDGRITNLTSRSAFRSFHDISTRIAIGVELGWAYLIKFPNAKTPEKQEIKFRAFTDRRAMDLKPITKKGSSLFLASGESDQELSFSVSFTDLTWGEDLANHMSSFVNSKTARFGRITRVAKSIDHRTVVPIVFSFGMLGSIFFSEKDNHSSKVLENYKIVLPSDALNFDFDRKLNFLSESQAVLLLKGVRVFAPLFQLMLVFTALYVISLALAARKASFISVNEHSEAYYNRVSHRFEIFKYGVILASIVGVVAGVFSSSIYEYLKSVHLFVP